MTTELVSLTSIISASTRPKIKSKDSFEKLKIFLLFDFDEDLR